MSVWWETVEAELSAPGVRVQIVADDMPPDFQRRMLHYGLGLCLSPQPGGAQAYYHTDEISGSYVDTGTVVFGPADAYIQGRCVGGSMRHLSCNFDREIFERTTGIGFDWNRESLSACLDIKSSRLSQTLMRLAQEALTPGLASSTMTECLGLVAALELARHFEETSANARSAAQELMPWQMRRVTRYVENLACYTPDIEEIAALCGVGSRHLRRLFKQTANQTIYEYAREVWGQKAKALLSDTELPLKEIAARLGFAGPSSFSTAFRRATGGTPKSFRQQFRRPH